MGLSIAIVASGERVEALVPGAPRVVRDVLWCALLYQFRLHGGQYGNLRGSVRVGRKMYPVKFYSSAAYLGIGNDRPLISNPGSQKVLGWYEKTLRALLEGLSFPFEDPSFERKCVALMWLVLSLNGQRKKFARLTFERAGVLQVPGTNTRIRDLTTMFAKQILAS